MKYVFTAHHFLPIQSWQKNEIYLNWLQQHYHEIGMKSVRDINLVSSIMTWLLFKFPMINVSQKRSDRYTWNIFLFLLPSFFTTYFVYLGPENDKKRKKCLIYFVLEMFSFFLKKHRWWFDKSKEFLVHSFLNWLIS